MLPLLLLGFGLILLTRQKTPAPPPVGPEVPIGPDAENFEQLQAGLAYQKPFADELIRAMVYRTAQPIAQPNTLLVLPAGGPAGVEGGAYWVLEALHDQGFVLWAPLHFHWPQSAQTGVFVLYLPPNVAAPPDYAILSLPDDPWPRLD